MIQDNIIKIAGSKTIKKIGTNVNIAFIKNIHWTYINDIINYDKNSCKLAKLIKDENNKGYGYINVEQENISNVLKLINNWLDKKENQKYIRLIKFLTPDVKLS